MGNYKIKANFQTDWNGAKPKKHTITFYSLASSEDLAIDNLIRHIDMNYAGGYIKVLTINGIKFH